MLQKKFSPKWCWAGGLPPAEGIEWPAREVSIAFLCKKPFSLTTLGRPYCGVKTRYGHAGGPCTRDNAAVKGTIKCNTIKM